MSAPRGDLAKGLSIAIGLGVLLSFALVAFIELWGKAHRFVLPPYAQLKVVSGVLQQDVFFGGAKSHAAIGRLRTDTGEDVAISCDADLDSLDCLYTRPYDKSENIGRRFTIRYFDYPSRRYPEYSVDGRVMPRRPYRIIMEVQDDKGATLVTYADSVRRLGAP